MHALDPFLPSHCLSIQEKIPTDHQDNNWLHFATKEVQFSSEKILLLQHMTKILEMHPSSFLEKNKQEISPFKIALIFRDYRLLSLFFFQLFKNFSPDKQTVPQAILNEKNSQGETALHVASLRGDYEMVFRLIDWGADPADLNSCDENFLHYLIANHHSDALFEAYREKLLQILRNHPSLIYQLNCNDQTPLKMALDKQNTPFLLLFLESGADVNSLFFSGGTFIYQAVFCQNTPLFNALMERGCDINLPSFGGWVPLHLAIAQNSIDCVRSLIASKKIDFSISCIYRQNFLHYALHFYRFDIVNLLCECPEVVELVQQKDLFGQTPMDLIVKANTYYNWLIDFHQFNVKDDHEFHQEILDKLRIGKEKIEKIRDFFQKQGGVPTPQDFSSSIIAQDQFFVKIRHWLEVYHPEEIEHLSFLQAGMCAGLSLTFLMAAKKNRLQKFFDRLSGISLKEEWVSDFAFFQYHFPFLKIPTALPDQIFQVLDDENWVPPETCVITEALATRHPTIIFIISSTNFCHMFSVYRSEEKILLFDANIPYPTVPFSSEEEAAEAIIQHINFQTNGMLKSLKIQFIDLQDP